MSVTVKKLTDVTIESLKTEITHLKRCNAGLRGYNVGLKETNADLNKSVNSLLDEKARNEAIIEKLTTKVADLESDYSILKQVIKEYNELPWYKRLLKRV